MDPALLVMFLSQAREQVVGNAFPMFVYGAASYRLGGRFVKLFSQLVQSLLQHRGLRFFCLVAM